MQIQQVTLFLAACTLSVLVVAYAQDETDPVFLSKLRDLAAQVLAEDAPQLFADLDDYKRGGNRKKGIERHSGINFGKRHDSESGEENMNANFPKRMRYHKGISFGKRAMPSSWNPWHLSADPETYNPELELGQFN
ncbi:uncharacterized protein [Diadema setosum]|uniref:uncharacterized protein n=1 Tax=Diadema setosum TaxID=31175 RepID=UPI003B3BA6D2